MQLWQMDVMGGVVLEDGTELEVVTGIDDHSRQGNPALLSPKVLEGEQLRRVVAQGKEHRYYEVPLRVGESTGCQAWKQTPSFGAEARAAR
jgi:hypothetical protein